MSQQSLKHYQFKPHRLNLAVQVALFGLIVTFTGRAFGEENQTPIELEQLEVTAPRIADQATNGYQTKKSRTATKTDTELIDVPQSITVITQEVVKDQSIQSVKVKVIAMPWYFVETSQQAIWLLMGCETTFKPTVIFTIQSELKCLKALTA